MSKEYWYEVTAKVTFEKLSKSEEEVEATIKQYLELCHHLKVTEVKATRKEEKV